MLHSTRASILASILLLSSACVPLSGFESYSYHEIGRFVRVEEGVILSSRPVQISSRSDGGGSETGAAIGALSGASAGHSGWSALWGAIIGAILGGAIESSLTTRFGFSYTVKLNSGDIRNIVQADRSPIPTGSPVLLELDSRNRGRIVPNPSPSKTIAARRTPPPPPAPISPYLEDDSADEEPSPTSPYLEDDAADEEPSPTSPYLEDDSADEEPSPTSPYLEDSIDGTP